MWEGMYRLTGTQWGVGHGGLHSANVAFQPLQRGRTRLVGNETSLRIIYDCGSGRGGNPRTAMADAIKRMLASLPAGGVIDLLAISHFDMDHVNGLDTLRRALDRHGATVARVWAPIITPLEALFTAGAVGNSPPGPVGNPMSRGDFSALLTDPTAALQERFPGAAVRGLSASTVPVPLAPRPSNDDADADAEEEEGRTAETFDSAVHPGLTTDWAHGGNREHLWEVVPYVIPSALAGLASVRQKAEALIGKGIDKCTVADLQQILSDKKLTSAFHNQVLAEHKAIKPVQRKSSARTATNLSTLCIYSGPVAPYRWARNRHGWNSIAEDPSAVPVAPSWLGTGDAGLFSSQHVDGMEAVLGRSRLDRVGVVSVPHHGSRFDSSPALWDALPNADLATIESDHATGMSGRSHPHHQVVRDLDQRGIRIKYATVGADVVWVDTAIR